MSSGIVHFVVGLCFVVVFLFVIDILPDIDHYTKTQAPIQEKFKDLVKGYLGFEYAPWLERGMLHTPIIPFLLLLISLLWLLHLRMDGII